MKKSLALCLCLAVVSGAVMLAACSDQLSRSYYTRNPMTVDQLDERWGKPVDIDQLENGIEKRVYNIPDPVTDLKYRYFLVKDGTVMASGVTDVGWTSAREAGDDTTGFVPSDMSVAYYRKNPMKAADLDGRWGKPAAVKELADGMQKRVYEIENPFTDFRYRYFLVKDGMVYASRISTDMGAADTAKTTTQKGLEINEVSNAYYQRHPMTLAEVEKTWGPVVMVETDDSGLEKRIYRIKDPHPGGFLFRYFLVSDDMVQSSGVTDIIDLP